MSRLMLDCFRALRRSRRDLSGFGGLSLGDMVGPVHVAEAY